MLDEMERLLRETARRPAPEDLVGFPARVRAAHEARAKRPWLDLRDLGFALSGAAVAVAVVLAVQPERRHPEASLEALSDAEIEAALAESALRAVDEELWWMDASELATLEQYLDEQTGG